MQNSGYRIIYLSLEKYNFLLVVLMVLVVLWYTGILESSFSELFIRNRE